MKITLKLILLLLLTVSSPGYAGDFGSPLPPETYTAWLNECKN